MAYDVFISYRRQGGGADARMMYDRLQNCGYTVSFDMDTLKNGNFNEELLKRVAECKNFVVLLSEGCFDRTLEGCKRENDWLRIEIATALYNNKNIVTVMLPGFAFPEKLPPDIDAIRNKNGPKYDLYYIDGFYDKLQKDFLIKDDAASDGKTVTALEEIFATPEVSTSTSDAVDFVDLIGDDTDFVRSEAEFVYSGISRLLPYDELSRIDGAWNEAESARAKGDYKSAAKTYLQVMDLVKSATPCASEFVMRMTADGIDTRKSEWFNEALSKAQGGDVDYQYGVGSLYAGGLGVPRDPAAAFRWFERAARSDHGAAQAAIGVAYAKGEGVEPDYVEARVWLEKAASKGYPVAEECLAWLYRHGYGVAKDFAKAIALYESSSKLGNPAAKYALADLYERGEGVDADFDRATELYRSAAADDHPIALRRLAELLFSDVTVEDKKEALAFCRRAVNVGDGESIVDLGLAYENGWGVDKDVKKAAELYQKALAKGVKSAGSRLEELKPEVQYQRGVACMEGSVTPRNFTLAREWFEKAAEQGHVDATCRLAELLQYGLGGKVDVKRAISLYEQADAGGSASAAVDLGFIYFQGRKAKEDFDKARVYYERACAAFEKTSAVEKWHAVYGYYRLGELYREGKGVEKNPLVAARLFRFAAVHGNVYACHDLGEMYRDGVGVRKSQVESDKCFSEMWRILNENLNPCDHWAMRTAGVACRDGNGTDHSFETAAMWWRRGLEFANPGAGALFFNTMRYHRELVKPGDFERVIEIFTFSAEGGDRVAMNNLGTVYQFDSLKLGVQDSSKAFEWRLKSAEAGYPGAMQSISNMYQNGDGVERDPDKSLDWLIKAAGAKNETAMRRLAIKYMGGTRLGRDFAKAKELIESVLEKDPEDVYASRLLARMYRDGIGISENPELAKKWYLSPIGTLNRNAEAEDMNDMDDLADYYKNGWGVEKDLKRAIDLYEKPASSGIAASMSSLNRIYRFNATGADDVEKADEWARKYVYRQTQKGGGAARGVADSCVGVGNYYRYGYGVDADAKTAYDWYLKASEKKSWEAMLKLASMCRRGEVPGGGDSEADMWARKAVEELRPFAENGLDEAQCALADCYANGWGVDQSYEEAVVWYAKSYDGRDWRAATRLARCYAEGRGVDKDEARAAALIKQASKRDNGEALGWLGECYEQAELGIPQDAKLSVECYQKSAAAGSACGMYNLGRCFEHGVGVAKDHAKALLWLRLAAAEKGDFWGYDMKAETLLKELTDAGKGCANA